MLFSLYLTFFLIGCLSFGGGYAALPLIQEFVVEGQGWLSLSEFVDLVAISQMTPGPIFINAATFVGSRVGGIYGSIVATAGAMTPQTILMLTLGYFLFEKERTFRLLDKILAGIKPGIVGLILIAALSMFQNSVFPGGMSLGNIDPVAALTFILGLILYGTKKLDLIKLVGLSAAIGIILSFFL